MVETNKKILFLALLLVLALPVFALADNPYIRGEISKTNVVNVSRADNSGAGGSNSNGGDSGGVTIKTMVDAAVRTAFYIAGGVVVILWLVTGYLFLVTQGAPDKLSAAKKALLAAVAGTVVVVVAGGAVGLVSNAFDL